MAKEILEYPRNLFKDMLSDPYPYLIDPEGIEKAIPLVMTEREIKMFNEHYKNYRTYEQVGKIFNLSESRTREILRRAVRKLKCTRKARRCYLVISLDKAMNEVGAVETRYSDKLNDLQAQVDTLFTENQALRKILDLPQNEAADKLIKLYETRLQDMGFSTRVCNILFDAGYRKAYDFIDISAKDIRSLKNVGEKIFSDTIKVLKRYGITPKS